MQGKTCSNSKCRSFGCGAGPTSVIYDEKARYEVQLICPADERVCPFVARGNRDLHGERCRSADEAFRDVVLSEYYFTCAVCESRFRLGDMVEATAAHIVPKHESGTDDPRNGLALCHTHHWAFDAGIFTLDSHYGVRLSPTTERADVENFGLVSLGGKAYPSAWQRRTSPAP